MLFKNSIYWLNKKLWKNTENGIQSSILLQAFNYSVLAEGKLFNRKNYWTCVRFFFGYDKISALPLCNFFLANKCFILFNRNLVFIHIFKGIYCIYFVINRNTFRGKLNNKSRFYYFFADICQYLEYTINIMIFQ